MDRQPQQDKGASLIPDALSKAGSVSVSYLESVQLRQGLFWVENDVLGKLQTIIENSFKSDLDLAVDKKPPMRTAANMLGIERVARVNRLRRLNPRSAERSAKQI